MSSTWAYRIAALAWACLLPVASAAAPPTPATAAPAAAKATPPPPGYVVGAGDVLQIVVRKEPELTRDTVVRPDGRVTVPLLGEIAAAGRTPEEISEEITRGLARFLTAPLVTVGVAQAISARAYIIGQVVRAGEVSLSAPLTVVQALALAGGFKEFAKTDSIRVVGRDGKVATFNYKKFEAGQELNRNVSLKPGDTVVVP